MEDKALIARQNEEEATQGRARLLSMQYLDSRDIVSSAPLLKEILELDDMYSLKAVPMKRENGALQFAITIRTPQTALRQLKNKFPDYNVSFVMISNSSFKEFMLRYDPPREVRYDDISIKNAGENVNIAQISQTLETVKADDILDYLITQAYKLNVSDIHLECERTYVRMRFRIDGTLHAIARLSHEKYRQLQSAIAIKANISTDAHDAQTGHMSHQLAIEGKSPFFLNMRIETTPTIFGQDAVVRLLNFEKSLLQLENLGIAPEDKEKIDAIIKRPHGMVLVVGPTGSGKTTTLYSVINELNDPQRKIITLEDPVEYAFEGVSQIQVQSRAGDSFAHKLKAVLRQDPDVIMLGEIRDVDTAVTSLQAALTGHLVLSTFHADGAIASLTRMMGMIGPNPMFLSAMRLIIAQRLVRRLDDETKIEYTPDEQLKKELHGIISSFPEGVDRPDIDQIKLYKPGTSEASPFGYKGRIMIMEQLVVTEQLRQAIMLNGVGANIVEEVANKQGMITILQDGIIRALQGYTSIEEVYRVI